jgi:hypothetical protein
MRFFMLVLVLFAFTGCGDSCSNTTKAEITSPDGKHVATAFIRNCGATTSFSPQVHLRQIGERMAQIGNVFVGDRSDKIRIEWMSASQLVIYSDCVAVRHETNYPGVAIEKRELK